MPWALEPGLPGAPLMGLLLCFVLYVCVDVCVDGKVCNLSLSSTMLYGYHTFYFEEEWMI